MNKAISMEKDANRFFLILYIETSKRVLCAVYHIVFYLLQYYTSQSVPSKWHKHKNLEAPSPNIRLQFSSGFFSLREIHYQN